MNYDQIIKIAQMLDEAGYPEYSRDLVQDVVDLEKESLNQEPLKTKPSVSENDYDVFISNVLLMLAEDGNLDLDASGRPTTQTLRAIVNTFDQNLSNADMSVIA